MEEQKLLRAFVGSGGAAMLVACLVAPQVERAVAQTSPGPNIMFTYVGSFTTAQRKARGDGIHVYRVDAATGMWTHVQHIGDLTNPSFLALSPDQRFLYSVHGDGDYATAFMLNGETG
jgi:6-phosphogluconolactonase